MNVTVINNRGGAPLELSITAEWDNDVFVNINIHNEDGAVEILDLIVEDPSELEQAVTEAARDFRRQRDRASEPPGPKAAKQTP